jgi:hypothetical protein
MKYEKPEVQVVADAASSIQHPGQKGVGGIAETATLYFSLNAYPADE